MKVTVSDIMSKKPCEEWTEEKIRKYIGEGKTLRQILKIKEIQEGDRIWCITKFLDDKTNREFAIWCARQCKTDDCKHFVETLSKIPDWVRNNAKWWSLTQISDKDFAVGLEYLIKKEIITIKEGTPSEGDSEPNLPSWLRKNAGWWSQGLLSDDEFFKSIQWMINNGFVKI